MRSQRLSRACGALPNYLILALGLQTLWVIPSQAQEAFQGPVNGLLAWRAAHSVPAAKDWAKDLAGRQAASSAPKKANAQDSTAAFTTFDVSGAGAGVHQGTFPIAINHEGAIAGNYLTSDNISHGFLRSRRGGMATFDAPGAANGTYPSSINPYGEIAGTYWDASFIGHAFFRIGGGALVTFDAPGAVIGTFPYSVNAAGEIVGYYWDGNFVPHGFVRYRNGSIVSFDAPGAINGTTAVGVSPAGVIVGMYSDANNANHGFLRDSGGDFTTFDPPGAINTFAPFSFGPDLYIDQGGLITGTYFEPISGNPFGGNYRAFVRGGNGAFTTFDAASYAPCCIWSFPSGINPEREIAGSFNDGYNRNHGFLRARTGKITTFDVPSAGSAANQGTVPLGITPDELIMGEYVDASNVVHGFIRTPSRDSSDNASNAASLPNAGENP